MAVQLDVFPAASAALLLDDDYGLFLLDAVHRARRRVLATQFLVELRPEFDAERFVQMLCRALAEASWRGVDVRIVLSRFVADPGLDVNGIARRWLQARGVPVRRYRPRPGSRREQLHTKLVVIDDDLGIVSSHNWTPGAFAANREAAVAVRSGDVAGRLAEAFEGYWEVAADGADGG
jgi:phosphatidylserine/phosphatidylglycerophosphate/cardiolipin synthase-like enzyme